MRLDRLLAKQFAPLEHTLTPRDCMLYALGVGMGGDAKDQNDLPFVYEDDLQVLPSMANVIAHPGAWVKDPALEINWVKLLHGEQSFTSLKPLRPAETYIGTYRVANVIDKGPEKGAMLFLEKTLTEKSSGDVVSQVTSTYVLRGDGGCGSTTQVAPSVHGLPDRPADLSIALDTLPQSALIYRLSGDYNPIHASPKVAAQAGFPRPILHGLCTLGIATRAILKCICDYDVQRFRSLSLRFSAPVYPGETIVTELWRENTGVGFRAAAAERNVLVLNNGFAETI